MIRILNLESQNKGRQGDHIYRTLQPCRSLAQQDGTFTRFFWKPIA